MGNNRSINLTSLERTSLTGDLARELHKWNKTTLGSFGARTIGLIATPLTSIIDSIVHAFLFIGKGITGIVVSPYNLVACEINRKYMASRDLELSSALVHLMNTVESVCRAPTLPIAFLLSPDKGYLMAGRHYVFGEAAKLKTKFKEEAGKIETYKKTSASKITSLEVLLASANKKLEKAESQLASKEKLIHEKMSEIEKLTQKYQGKMPKELQQKQEEQEKELEVLKQEIAALKNLQTENTLKIAQLKKEKRDIQQQVSADLEKSIAESTAGYEEYVKKSKLEIEELNKKLSGKESELQAKLSLEKDLKLEIKKLQGLAGSLANKDPDEINLKLEAKREKLKTLQSEIASLIEKHRKDEEAITKITEEKAALLQEAEIYKQACRQTKSILQGAMDEIDSLKKKVAELELVQGSLKNQASEIQSMQEKILWLQEQNKKDDEVIVNLSKEKEGLSEKLSALRKEKHDAILKTLPSIDISKIEVPDADALVAQPHSQADVVDPVDTNDVDELINSFIEDKSTVPVLIPFDMDEKMEELQKSLVEKKLSMLEQIKAGGFKLKSTKESTSLKAKHLSFITKFGLNPMFLTNLYNKINDFLDNVKESQDDGKLDMAASWIKSAGEDPLLASTIFTAKEKRNDEEKIEFLVSKISYFEKILEKIKEMKADAGKMKQASLKAISEHGKSVAEAQAKKDAEELAQKRLKFVKEIRFDFAAVETGVEAMKWKLFLTNHAYGDPAELKDLHKQVKNWCEGGNLEEPEMLKKFQHVKEIVNHHEYQGKGKIPVYM